MFAVCVRFDLHPNSVSDFMPLMRAQAVNSLEFEPGCLRFDIWSNEKRPSEVYLYEIYTSAEAFQKHLDSDHFTSFNAATAPLIADKTVTTWDNPVQVDHTEGGTANG